MFESLIGLIKPRFSLRRLTADLLTSVPLSLPAY